MHPSQDKLRQFVESELDANEYKLIEAHLRECELCKEFCEDYSDLLDSMELSRKSEIPRKTMIMGDSIYQEALNCAIIDLIPLKKNVSYSNMKLAADGDDAPGRKVRNLATLYSEDPEVVLRIMRDMTHDKDYLQIICDNEQLISHAMVRIPELGHDFLTDAKGFSIIEQGFSEEYENKKWQIKMPSATFDLDPLKYDPENVEYTEETIIETKNNDKILVSFEGKTKGKQISISILQLNGKTDFGEVKVHISQKSSSITQMISSSDKISFEIVDPSDEIKIRLYQ
jgi:hypothetical protein